MNDFSSLQHSFCHASRLKLAYRKFFILLVVHSLSCSRIMAEAQSLRGRVSTGWDHWKRSTSFAGYSFICKRPAETKLVLRVLLSEFSSDDARTNPTIWTEFTGFVFVQPEKSMTVNAFDSWRWRNSIRRLDLICHKSGDTAAEGLLSILQA